MQLFLVKLSRIDEQCRTFAKNDYEKQLSIFARYDSLQTLHKMTIRNFGKIEKIVKKKMILVGIIYICKKLSRTAISEFGEEWWLSTFAHKNDSEVELQILQQKMGPWQKWK